MRVALEESERLFDGVYEGPVEIKQLLSGASRKNNFGHASAGGATLGEILAKIVERDGLASCDLAEARFDGRERVRVRQNFCGLFERVILVDGDERGGGLAIACDEDVIPSVGDVTQ